MGLHELVGPREVEHQPSAGDRAIVEPPRPVASPHIVGSAMEHVSIDDVDERSIVEGSVGGLELVTVGEEAGDARQIPALFVSIDPEQGTGRIRLAVEEGPIEPKDSGMHVGELVVGRDHLERDGFCGGRSGRRGRPEADDRAQDDDDPQQPDRPRPRSAMPGHRRFFRFIQQPRCQWRRRSGSSGGTATR